MNWPLPAVQNNGKGNQHFWPEIQHELFWIEGNADAFEQSRCSRGIQGC